MSRRRDVCSVDGCGREVEGYQPWCHGHYEFRRRTGRTPAQPFLDTPEKRSWAKVDKHGPDGFHYLTGANLGECWLWLAATDGRGRYGSFYLDGRLHRAHRVAYRFLHGLEPEGAEDRDHLCRVTLYVRPSHGEWTTHAENLRRGNGWGGVNIRKTHCPQGHPYDEENTYLWSRRRARICKACRAARARRRAAA